MASSGLLLLHDISQKAQELIAIKALFGKCGHKSYPTIFGNLKTTLALPPADKVSHKEQDELKQLNQLATLEAKKVYAYDDGHWICKECNEDVLVDKKSLSAALGNVLNVLTAALKLPVYVPKY